MFVTFCTSCPAYGLGDPVRMSPTGARYYTAFGEFHQLDVKNPKELYFVCGMGLPELLACDKNPRGQEEEKAHLK
jgi:hypothetical protein